MAGSVTLVSATNSSRGSLPPPDHADGDIQPAGFSGSGFSDRAPVSTAWAWLDGVPVALGPDLVPLAEAVGRVLAEAVVVGDPPAELQSAENGYAVRAADCDGASPYNPLLLALSQPGAASLPAASACPVASGWTLPVGADAVLPFDSAQVSDPHWLDVLAPIAPGTGLQRQVLRAGTTLLESGRRLRPQDVACLTAFGISGVTVVRRPRVALLVAGPKSGADALTPLLRALLARDAALIEPIPIANADSVALQVALTTPTIISCDLVLLAGRSGAGLDDTAPVAVRGVGGALALHGLALHPGGSAALGTLPVAHGAEAPANVPIVLLPGDPLACLVAYDILAARLVRRLAGILAALPYPVAECELARKIVSGIGTLEVVPVRLSGGRAHPIAADTGLAAVVQADGFVVVAEGSEGHPGGARVRVHLYGTPAEGAAQDMTA